MIQLFLMRQLTWGTWLSIENQKSGKSIGHKIIWNRSKVKKCKFKPKKHAGFFQTPYYFSLIFVDNNSHKFRDQPPSPHYQCCLQVFGTVWCCKLWYCFSFNILQNWLKGRGMLYFCKVDHSRISIAFFRNLPEIIMWDIVTKVEEDR